MPSHSVAPRTLSISHEESARLLREYFGIEPLRLSSMHSELSTVERVDLEGGSTLVFRASCATPNECEVAQWRVGAMNHLAARGVPTGAAVPALDGSLIVSAESESGSILLQVGEWLDGVMLKNAAPTPALMRSVGRTAGAVSAGLADWPKPPGEVGHTWELIRTTETVRSTIDSLSDAPIRALLDEAMGRFVTNVEPRLSALPQSVVHHDLHDSNILVDPSEQKVSGVLDFGDMVFGPRIADLAVPATHAGRTSEDPVEAFMCVAEGWGHTTRLTDEEIELVFDAGLGRLAVNLSVWTSRADSDRAEYARARSAPTEYTLRRLLAADRGRVIQRLRALLG